MNNKAPVMDQHNEIRIPDWLYGETQEDDFLMGKTPTELQDTWEEEE